MAFSLATAMLVGGIASAGASLAGGLVANQGAQSQADAALQASQQAIAEQRRQYDLSRSDLAPWRMVGTEAINRLGYLLGLGSPTGAGAPKYASGGTNAYADYLGGVGGSGDRTGSDVRFGGGTGPDITAYSLDGTQPDFWATTPFADAGLNQGFGDQRTPNTAVDWIPKTSYQSMILAARNENKHNNGQGTGGGTPVNAYANVGGDFGSLMRDFTPQDFLSNADPGYGFRMAEGEKALERSAAARGGLVSGRTGKELLRYGQDFASNEYSKAFDRYNLNRTTKYNFLAGPAGLGQTAAQQTAQLGMGYANNYADLLTGGMTSAAAARAAGNQALTAGITGAVQGPLNWYLLSQLQRQQPRVGA